MDRVMFIAFLLILVCDKTFAQLSFDTTLFEKSINADSTQLLQFSFKFQNKTKRPIKLIKIDTSCSCMVAKLEKETYFPNEAGEIKGVFNIQNRSGIQEKEIIVHTDYTSQSKIKLLLRIRILDPIEIKPRLVYWEKNSPAKPKCIILTVPDPNWKVKAITCEKSKFNLTHAEEKGKYIIVVKPASTKISLRDIIKAELENGTNKKTFLIHALIK